MLSANRAGLTLLAGPSFLGHDILRERHEAGEGWAIMALEGPGALVSSIGPDLRALRTAAGQAFARWSEVAGSGNRFAYRAGELVNIDETTGANGVDGHSSR